MKKFNYRYKNRFYNIGFNIVIKIILSFINLQIYLNYGPERKKKKCHLWFKQGNNCSPSMGRLCKD